MKLEKRKPSGREKDEAALELLEKLRTKLHSEDISAARLAAFNLSWMQEDGLGILQETLFGDFSRTAKKAAAYGLRSMKGRMKKLASEVLQKGLEHRNRTTKAACEKALFLMAGGDPNKSGGRRKPKGRSGNSRIQEIRRKSGRRTQSQYKRTRSGQ